MPPTNQETDTLFYDGHCALCHGTVRFVVKHDRAGAAFRYAPLQGETFRAQVPAEQRARLPDSIVVRTSKGLLLARSEAVVRILQRLGGGWRIVGSIMAAIPRGLRDAIYDLIARIRYRVFGKREELCPIVTPELLRRFDP